MKKFLGILTVLLLIGVFFFTYHFFNFRKACQWKSEKNPGDFVKKKNVKNHLHQVLFFNEMYRNYDSFYPKDQIPLYKFSAVLSSLSILKGKKREKYGDLLLTGKEIVIAAWNPADLMDTYRLDLMEMELLSGRNIKIETFIIPKTRGVGGTIKTFFKENLLSQNPQGNFLHKHYLKFNKKRQFKKVPLICPGQIGTGKSPLDPSNSFAGLLIKMNPIGKTKKIRVKIRKIYLLNHKFKIIENMPRVDYFKYGNFDRKHLKSVFLRAGSTITYSIKTGSEQNTKIFFDGYLGSVDGKQLTFKLLVNEKPILLKEISKGLSYFKREVAPRNRTLTFTVTISGEKGGIGVLGNLSFYRPFKTKRNVVYYLIDALRADKCGIEKNLFEKNFKDGAVFKSAYTNATQTAYSLSALFSGKYKFTLVKKDGEVPHVQEKEFLLAEYFKTKGYTTAAFINNPWLHLSNSSQGFDFINLCWKPVKKPSPFPSEKDYIKLKYGEMKRYMNEFVRENKNKPVFLFIHTMEPHIPYESPKERRNYSANADPGILKTLFRKVTLAPSYPTLMDPNAEQLKVLKSLYKDQVLIAYDFFKRVYDDLYAESTANPSSLFILTSDHGERFYEHHSWIHGPPDVYNEVLRIPFMIKGPGIKAGVYDNNVQLVDIYPTIIDWLGDKQPKGLVGNSLLDYMEKKDGWLPGRIIYSDGTGNIPHYAYIKDKIKVVIKGDKTEVYDLNKDPGETINLQGNPRYKEMISDAKHFRQKFKKSFGKKKRRMSPQERQRLKTLGYIE